jgi:hypothetical protein
MVKESNLLRFIRERQQHCASLLDVVSVHWIGGGRLNQCFMNAYETCRHDEVFVVSGWLALPYNKQRQSQQFTQHWWNYSRTLDRYIDISPDIEDGALYVIDMDIARFAMEHHGRLKSCVPMSLLYKDDTFSGIEVRDGGLYQWPLAELTTQALFAPYLSEAAEMPVVRGTLAA